MWQQVLLIPYVDNLLLDLEYKKFNVVLFPNPNIVTLNLSWYKHYVVLKQ